MGRVPLIVRCVILAILAGAPPARAEDCPSAVRCIGEGPLAPISPWPKFRGNMRQDGASRVVPREGGKFWVFKTSKGVYSSPVVGGDGTVYVGSADRTFYALNPDGSVRWRLATGEVIDSAALLDDQGKVYFGSGDGHLYARDAQTGAAVWTFAAEDPSVHDAFINWFEGNVAIGTNGDLYAPNDNFAVYAVDRETGARRWKWLMNDQTWSSPAVDPVEDTLFIGNNYLAAMRWMNWFWKNIFAIGPNGQQEWRTSVRATVAASPMLTGDGKMILGAFDGYVRGYRQANGSLLWSFPTNDHVYASAARLADGTVVVPSTDGSVYALDPETGALRWHFDTREPIHSSPSVDGLGRIYFGGGDGRLYVLNGDGTLRWSIQLTLEDRNDLNASPALGLDAVYLAGESGEIYSVPYDYCLRSDQALNPRCAVDARGPLFADGAKLEYVSPLGTPLGAVPEAIPVNQALAFGLRVRQAGTGVLALLDESTLVVTSVPTVELKVEVSGDRRFVTVEPVKAFPAGDVRLKISGKYLVEPARDGLKMTGGRIGGTFTHTAEFTATTGSGTFAYSVPADIGAPAGTFELYRMAAPLPSVLPSYNQIGFDSLHYLVGMVEGAPGRAIGWVIGGLPDLATDVTAADPATKVLFPVEVETTGGLMTLRNEDGFVVNAMNAEIPFSTFRVAASLDANGKSTGAPSLHVTTDCRKIPTYGTFLVSLGFCHPETGIMNVYGSGLIRPVGGGTTQAPSGVGAVTFTASRSQKTLVAKLSGSALRPDKQTLGLLVIDDATGKPVGLPYGLATTRRANADGTVAEVTLSLKRDGPLPARIRVYLMVDTYPVARTELDL